MAYLQIAARLKQLRMESGMTQAQVARYVGVTRSAFSAYENGTRYPSYDTLVNLARLFSVSTDFLLCADNRRFIDVSGLTAEETAAITNMVNLLRSKK